jgi:hypothetical protein
MKLCFFLIFVRLPCEKAVFALIINIYTINVYFLNTAYLRPYFKFLKNKQQKTSGKDFHLSRRLYLLSISLVQDLRYLSACLKTGCIAGIRSPGRR